MREFDKRKFHKLVKEKFDTFQKYCDALEEDYLLTRGVNSVQKWGQPKNPNVPTLKEYPIIAESLGVDVTDLFTGQEHAREKITEQELTFHPQRYSQSISNAFLSSLPDRSAELIELFAQLTDEQRAEVLETIEKYAGQNRKF